MESLILFGSGVGLLVGIGAYKLSEHFHRKKIERLDMQNDYLLKRNVSLRARVDHAEGKERQAMTALFLAERGNAIAQAYIVVLEAREKEWSKRIMATMTEQEAA